MLLASTKIYMLMAPPACLGHLTLGIFILRKIFYSMTISSSDLSSFEGYFEKLACYM